jgi:signal transduction histidine kinase
MRAESARRTHLPFPLNTAKCHIYRRLVRFLHRHGAPECDVFDSATSREAVMTIADIGRMQKAAESQLKHLSFLNHDLNNNLSAIALHLQLLKERLGASPALSTEADSVDLALDSIRRTTEGMRRLLTYGHLRHQKTGRTGPIVRPLDLCVLVEQILAQFELQAGHKNLHLLSDVPPEAVVESDRELISLVLQNLVGNSLKYSTAGTVRLDANRSKTAAGADQWVLSVSDQGPGIPPDQQRRIFQAFQRGESHDMEGMGLGLAIAADAAAMLGAALSVESQLGVGSTFRLVLPEAREAASVPGGGGDEEAASERTARVRHVADFAVTGSSLAW